MTAVLVGVLLAGCGVDDSGLPRRGTAAATSPVSCDGRTRLTAEGSSAQKGAIDAFIAAYQANCRGKNVGYRSTGSAAGVRQFLSGLVDFAGTDSPLSAERGEVHAAAQRCGGNPAWHLPLVFGAVAVAYRLDGVSGLNLDAGVLAGIFGGTVKKWDDPAIAALNRGVDLPDRGILPVVRDGESGTSENLQRYLTVAAGGRWTLGTGQRFAGVGARRATSEEMARATAAVDGAITYVELSLAREAELGVARIDAGSGPVELTAETVGRAVDRARVAGQGNDLVLDLDSIFATDAADAYPIVLTTYEVVCSRGYDQDTATAVKAFLMLAATEGQRGLNDAGYAPLPERFRSRLVTAIDAIG